MGKVPPKKRPPRKVPMKVVTIVLSPKMPGETKRSEALIVKILEEITYGLNINTACVLHDLDDKSWRRWRKCENLSEDMFTDDGLERSEDDRRCWSCQNCLLQKRCDKARLEFIKVHHGKVATATIKGEDVWTANAWLLERTNPTEYGSKTKQEITHTLNAGNSNAQKLVAAIIAAATKSE